MANYMNQPMSSGILKKITYYRKQSQKHPSHKESGKFTDDAVKHYAALNKIKKDHVEKGKYEKCKGIPTGGETCEI